MTVVDKTTRFKTQSVMILPFATKILLFGAILLILSLATSSSFFSVPIIQHDTRTTDTIIEDSPVAAIERLVAQANKETTSSSSPVKIQLNATDYLVMADPPKWDSSPIVVERFQLLFFTTEKVGCSVWKQLFRRIMGFKDWNDPSVSPHNPATNGLVYLRDLPLEQANAVLNSNDWTRAMFVRDPKERFLSAFLEKSLSRNGTSIVEMCRRQRKRFTDDELWKLTRTFEGFVNLTRKCHDDHWLAQSERMTGNVGVGVGVKKKKNAAVDSPLWNTLDFVGHMETVAEDAQLLLKRIGAWDDFGKSGWDGAADRSIFQSQDSVGHKTGAADRLARYYTPQLEVEIDRRYAQDYQVAILGLEPRPIDFESSS
jgi:hypothetical protein